MPIRYVGKKGFFKGKTLIEIAGNLKNLGVGRVVVRNQWDRYPEPSYYRLTKVVPDLSTDMLHKGEVEAYKVFRGQEMGVMKVESSGKPDWRLIPRDEEELVCKQPLKNVEKKTIPSTMKLPPLMDLYMRSQLRKAGQDDSQPLFMAVKIKRKTQLASAEETQ